MLTPDLIYAHSTGAIEDKAKYLGNMKSGTQRYAGIEPQTPTVRMHGDSALTHTIVRMHGVNASGPFDNKVMMIHMWVKSAGNGSWPVTRPRNCRRRLAERGGFEPPVEVSTPTTV